MSNPYFFISKRDIEDDSVLISGADHWHLVKVLRAKKGEHVGLSDNEDTGYEAVIKNIGRTSAILNIIRTVPLKRRIPEISLYLCILKKDAMELAIQKNTEIGVDMITPVFCSRSVVDIAGEKLKDRILRWQQIAYNASRQSKRSFISRVLEPVDIGNIPLHDHDIFFLPYEGHASGRQNSSLLKLMDYFRTGKKVKLKKIAFIIGPEGGFEDVEIEQLSSRGAVKISFGRNILRSETASLYLASIIDFLLKVQDEKDFR